jgi:bifunctional non-homologous end joining protein LigD
VNWVAPRLVCEVGYKEYTRDGHLRQPAFKHLRDDKAPEECQGRFDDPSGRILTAAPEPEVTVTHYDKIFYPELDLSKGDLVTYYERIAPWMLPYLHDRPIVLTRYPDGIHGKSFYQRDAPDFVPDWIKREALWSEGADREVRYFIVQSTAALKYLANLGTIPIHLWHSRITDMEHPDWCVLDLDPKKAPFKDVVTLAQAIGELADEIQLPAYPKTSGASGLHVLIPLGHQLTHDQARTLGELMARVIVDRFPNIATIARSVASRRGKVYVDYLQNGHGRLIAAPFAARAEATAGVSMPLKWTEVNGRLSNARFHIKNAPARLKRLKQDPLAGIWDDEPDLARALARLAEIMASD